MDRLAMNSRLDRSFISGYSSFVNITRQRTIDLTLSSPEQELIYARMTFDTPEWDMDHLKLWKHTKHGDQLIKQLTSCFPDTRSDLNTIVVALNSSCNYLGGAVGTICGGLLIEHRFSAADLPYFAAAVAALALFGQLIIILKE